MAFWNWWRRDRRPKESATTRRRDLQKPLGLRTLETSCPLLAAVENAPEYLTVRNIFAEGISLIVSRPFEPETVVNLVLLNQPKVFLVKLPVRVLYTVEHPSGLWILAAAFARRLSDDERDALLG